MPAQEKFDLIVRARDEATATLRKINAEIDRTGSSSLPRLTAGLTTYERSALKADLRTAALGASLSGLNPQLSQMASTLLIASPVVAAVSLGLGLMVQAINEATTSEQKHVEAIRASRTELVALATSTESYAKIARGLITESDALLNKEKLRAEVSLSMAKHGLREATVMEILGGSLKYVNIQGEEQKKIIADLTLQLAGLNKQLAPSVAENLAGFFNATIGPMTSVDEITARIAANTKLMNDRWQQSITLMTGGDLFGGLGDTRFLGFSTPEGQAIKEAERLKEMLSIVGEGPMSWLTEHDALVERATKSWQSFSGVVLSSTDQLATGITDMFFGLRDSLDEVFRSMAMSWVKYFINEIIKQTALKLGFALFNVIFPGAGGVLKGASAVGDFPIDDIVRGKRFSGGTGIDVISAGARRFSGPSSASASTTVIIQGDIIGTDEFVGKRIIPAIENAIRFQKTSIAGR